MFEFRSHDNLRRFYFCYGWRHCIQNFRNVNFDHKFQKLFGKIKNFKLEKI